MGHWLESLRKSLSRVEVGCGVCEVAWVGSLSRGHRAQSHFKLLSDYLRQVGAFILLPYTSQMCADHGGS